MRLVILFAAVAALAAAGCDDEKGTGATPGAGTEAQAADLPVPADFEDEAEKAITSSNYKDELASLEKEVDAP